MQGGLAFNSFLFLDIDGGVWGHGPADCPILNTARFVRMKPRKIPKIPAMESISVAPRYAVYVDTNAIIWASGMFKGQTTKPVKICSDVKPKVIQALCAAFYVITEEGDLWEFGVVDPPLNETQIPIQKLMSTKRKLANIPAIKHVSGGTSHTFLIDESGSLWSGGCSSYGKLGRRSLAPVFERIEHPGSFVDACGGTDHSLFLDSNGNVWSCGSNRFGQLGLPLNIPGSNELIKVEGVEKITCICAGGYSSIMIDEFGNTWVCGKNLNGQLGLDCDLNATGLQIVPDIPKMKMAFCQDEHAIYVDENDQVYACGLNRGQLDQDVRKASKILPYSELLKIPLMLKSSKAVKSARNI